MEKTLEVPYGTMCACGCGARAKTHRMVNGRRRWVCISCSQKKTDARNKPKPNTIEYHNKMRINARFGN